MSNQDPPKAVRVDSWSFDGSWPARRPGIPMVGIFLIILGVLLGAGQLFSQAQLGASAFFLAVGLVLVIVGLRDRSDLALYVGVFITALALSDVLHSMNVIRGPGWGTLFLGLGVMAIALIRSTAGRRWGWALGIGLLLALWGGSDVAASYANFPTDRLIGPLLVVLLGVYIVTRTMTRDERPLIEQIRNPSGSAVFVWILLSIVPLVWPVSLYVLFRYLTGHRAPWSIRPFPPGTPLGR